MSQGATVTKKGTKRGFLSRRLDQYGYAPDATLAGAPHDQLALSFPGRVITSSPTLMPFFNGLVPEGWLLNVVRETRPELANDRFALLLAFGEDTMGSVSVTASDEPGAQSVTNKLDFETLPAREAARLQRGHFCLCCMEPLAGTGKTVGEYHRSCAMQLFLFVESATLAYDFTEFRKAAAANLAAKLSLPGVQPKVSLSYNPLDQNQLSGRLTTAGIGRHGLFILKPTHPNITDFPANEALCMELARRCGVSTAVSGLIRDASGQLNYITRRFDRTLISKEKRTWTVERHSMEDFGQISGKLEGTDRYDVPADHIGMILHQFRSPVSSREQLFRQVYFSFLIGNYDLHARNLAVLTDAGVRLAPAFDLTSCYLIDGPQHASSAIFVNQKKASLRKVDFVEFGDSCGMSEEATLKIMGDMNSSLNNNLYIADRFMRPGTEKILLGYLKERASETDNIFHSHAGASLDWTSYNSTEENRIPVGSSTADTSQQTSAMQEIPAYPAEVSSPKETATNHQAGAGHVHAPVATNDARNVCSRILSCKGPKPPTRLKGRNREIGLCSYCQTREGA